MTPGGADGAPEPCLAWHVVGGGAALGTLVVDRLIAGRACGGIRIAPVVTPDELGALAAVMTLKFAFFGIACGGAKAGLVMPRDTVPEERRRRARAFGAALAPLLRCGTYVPGTDLGCDERDLWEVRAGAGIDAGHPPPASPVETSATAHFSGTSAAIAAIVALPHRAAGATCAVLGYGRVGAAFAARFVAAGGRIVAVSTADGAIADPAGLDLARLEHARMTHGEEAPRHYAGGAHLRPADLLALDVDVLAPCATAHMIDGETWPQIRARVVTPGANAAITTDAEAGLVRAGILVVPDFVANAGGILVSHFWPLPLSPAVIAALLERHFRAIVEDLLARAAAGDRPVPELARELAQQNLARLAHDHRSAVRHELLIGGLARSRLRRALPDALVRPFVLRVARALGPPLAA
jgi:glutamate dehydrogenase/leucine dehydrogenase